MPWDDQDDLDFILERSKEEEEEEQAAAATPGATGMRSIADDILDEVAGQTVAKRDKSLCPKCGGATKKRGPGVGPGLQTRKCRSCGHEYAVGMLQNRSDVRRVPEPVPHLGPFTGEGGPPLDPNQPIQRRIAEHIRRARDNEP